MSTIPYRRLSGEAIDVRLGLPTHYDQADGPTRRRIGLRRCAARRLVKVEARHPVDQCLGGMQGASMCIGEGALAAIEVPGPMSSRSGGRLHLRAGAVCTVERSER